MTKLSKNTYKALYTNPAGGYFPTNNTQEIGSDDMRKLSDDTGDSMFMLEDDKFTGAGGTLPGINTIAGLKTIATANLPANVHITFRDTGNGDALRVYDLFAGAAAESLPNVVRPNDYDAGSPKTWRLSVVGSGSGTVGDIDGGDAGADYTGIPDIDAGGA
jgi:hypothetical protein